MNKKGQFYLVAMIVLVVLFIGLATISNYSKESKSLVLTGVEKEIQIEIRNTLDYIYTQRLSDSNTFSTFKNFSNEFITKIGGDKDILFIFGNQNNLTFVGNKLENTKMYTNTSGTFDEISINGTFELNSNPSANPITVQLDEEIYEFELFEGQNIYYLVKHSYSGGVYIVHG